MSRSIAIAAALLPLLAGCSLGQGDGQVRSEKLYAKDCWGVEGSTPEEAQYRMDPDFFAAIPYRETLTIRVQRGSDLSEVSDGLMVLIDDVPELRQHRLNEPLRVSLPPGVSPPGSPTTPPPELIDDPPLVHMALYLQRSCHTQGVVLYSVDGTITFERLFSGDPNEKSAEEKLTRAKFEVAMGDPHDAPLGHYASDVPEDKRSKVEGYFDFYFERGQPGQPFP